MSAAIRHQRNRGGGERVPVVGDIRGEGRFGSGEGMLVRESGYKRGLTDGIFPGLERERYNYALNCLMRVRSKVPFAVAICNKWLGTLGVLEVYSQLQLHILARVEDGSFVFLFFSRQVLFAVLNGFLQPGYLS